jgi:TM2 domain-containing membrane protein YozV
MKTLVASILLLALPSLAFAQDGTITNTSGFIGSLNNIIGIAGPIIYALAILFFLYKLLMFLLAKDAEGKAEGRKDAQGGLIWGIVILVVMFSIGGILGLVQETFDIDGGTNLTAPTIDVTGGRVQTR